MRGFFFGCGATPPPWAAACFWAWNLSLASRVACRVELSWAHWSRGRREGRGAQEERRQRWGGVDPQCEGGREGGRRDGEAVGETLEEERTECQGTD